MKFKLINYLLIFIFFIPIASAKTIELNIEEDMVDRNFAFENYLSEKFVGTYDESLINIKFNLVNPPFNSTNVRNVEIQHEIQVNFEAGKSLTLEDSLVNHTVVWDFTFQRDGSFWTGSWCRPSVDVLATLDGEIKIDRAVAIPTVGCLNQNIDTIIIKYTSTIMGNETNNTGFLLAAGGTITPLDSNGLLDAASRITNVNTASFVVGDYYTNFQSPAPELTVYATIPINAARVQYRFVTGNGVISFFEENCNQPGLNVFIRAGCFLGDIIKAVGQTLLDGAGKLISLILNAFGINDEVQNTILQVFKFVFFLLKITLTLLVSNFVAVWLLGFFLWVLIGTLKGMSSDNLSEPFLWGGKYVKFWFWDLWFGILGFFVSRGKQKPTE